MTTEKHATKLDVAKLEREVKNVYRNVATAPDDEQHFVLGRELAEGYGYPPEELDQVPERALESYAGADYHFDLADIQPGDDVLDLGSGSGTDVFIAAHHAGDTGSVTGIDMTREQIEKARTVRDEAGIDNVSFESGYIEDLPFEDDAFDVVISNGVINLSPEKDRVYEEASRVLKPDGRLAISDITSEVEMPESIQSDEDLWAACIGGATQVDQYTDIVEAAGFDVFGVRQHTDYVFTADAAIEACEKYGIKVTTLGGRRR